MTPRNKPPRSVSHRQGPLSWLAAAVLAAALSGGSCGSQPALVVEPLRIINWEPAGGAFCVTADVTVRVTFSADIDPDTLTSDSLYLLDAGGKIAAALEYDAPNLTATLTPAQSLGYGRLHTAVASTAIRSAEAGRLVVDLDASFTTVQRSGCQPNVECQLPSDCPGTQICANIGVCSDECVTDKDCYQGTCSGGTCI